MNKVPARKPNRQKHVPQRTCVGCREIQPKRSFIRIVKGEGGVRIDPTGKAKGRGAYLHEMRSCWERGLKGPLAHALRTEIDKNDMAELISFMNSLAVDEREPNSVIREEPQRDL